MDYVKRVLSLLAAISLAELLPFFPWSPFKGISQEKATGVATVAGGFAESIVSPLFWIVTILFFALFLGTSRVRSKFLRILLFWIPTLLVSTLGCALFTLFAYVLIRFRHR